MIPFSSDYVLAADVFPAPFIRADVENKMTSSVNKEVCNNQQCSSEAPATAEVEIAHALLHNTAVSHLSPTEEQVIPAQHTTTKVIPQQLLDSDTAAPVSLPAAAGDFDLVTVITDKDETHVSSPDTHSPDADLLLHTEPETPATDSCEDTSTHPTLPPKLKLSLGQYLNLRSRKLLRNPASRFALHPHKPKQTQPVVPVSDSQPTVPDTDKEIPVPQQLTFYTHAASVGHSQIMYLFPDLQLDHVVLFGTNYNYHYPVSEGFSVDALVTHFVCLNASPLQLAIIVPHDFKDNSPDCVAITINDFLFKARLFDFETLKATLYGQFGLKK